MVRRAEGALVQQPDAAGQGAGDAVDLGGLNRLLEGEGRENAREALGQHGFTRPWRPDHQDVVRSGRGDFEGALRHGLPADIAEVGGHGRFRLRSMIFRHGRGELLGPREQGHHLRQMPHAVHIDALDHRRFSRVLGGHYEVGNAFLACADRHRQSAADRAHRAIERKLARKDVMFQPRNAPHGAENPDGHRQIEARSLFADVGRGQVDGERLVGVPEAGVHERGFDPLAALAHGYVGHSHGHGVLGIAGGVQVDFDIDQVSIDAVNGGAEDLEEGHSWKSD